MTDTRTLRTDAAIKDALLEMLGKQQLAQITVSDICRTAQVSRSTFYGHFRNVQEVFECLINDFVQETRSLKVQLKCKSCARLHPTDKMPYCIAIRTTKRYANLVKEPQYLHTLLKAALERMLGNDILQPYLELGVEQETARSLFQFQMAGCHIAAISSDATTPWEERQLALDTFIAGGMEAVRNLARKEP